MDSEVQTFLLCESKDRSAMLFHQHGCDLFQRRIHGACCSAGLAPEMAPQRLATASPAKPAAAPARPAAKPPTDDKFAQFMADMQQLGAV